MKIEDVQDLPSAWAWFLGSPLRSLIIIAVGFVVLVIGRWILARVMRRLARAPLPEIGTDGKVTVTLGTLPSDHARRRRVETMQQITRHVLDAVVVTVVVMMVLEQWGVSVAPLLASAGVVGIALAFGAQSLVADVFAGMFMLVENQYNVGDRVELGALGSTLAAGSIEEVGLRVTRLRDDDGKVWYVRNGQILRVANESQGWSIAVVDIALAPDTEIEKVLPLVNQLVKETVSDPELADIAREDPPPTVRVVDISATATVVQVRAQAAPGEGQRLASALRSRLHTALVHSGVTLA